MKSPLAYLLGVILTSIGLTVTTVCSVVVPAEMPVQPYDGVTVSFAPPAPNRNPDVYKWLEPCVRIYNGNTAGSGTVCYYDSVKNLAYVVSCGHLFSPSSRKTCEVQLFYREGVKLPAPSRHQATVLAVNLDAYGDDLSVLQFTPPWKPAIFPIGDPTYVYEVGSTMMSVGCDNASDPALYTVKVVNLQNPFLVTTENSPRPGRSGGGLMEPAGKLVGVCVRTSRTDGTGVGFFVPSSTVHQFIVANKLAFLLRGRTAVPIVDRNNRQGTYPDDYVPVPAGRVSVSGR